MQLPGYQLAGPVQDALAAVQVASHGTMGQPVAPQTAASNAQIAAAVLQQTAPAMFSAPVAVTSASNVAQAIRVYQSSVIKDALVKKLRAKKVNEDTIARLTNVPDRDLSQFLVVLGNATKARAIKASPSKATMNGPLARAKMNGPIDTRGEFPSNLPGGALPAPLDAASVGAVASQIPVVGAALQLPAAAATAVGQVGGVLDAAGDVASSARSAISSVRTAAGGIITDAVSSIGDALMGIADFTAGLFGDSITERNVKNAIAAANVQSAIAVAQRVADQMAAQTGTPSIFSSPYSVANQTPAVALVAAPVKPASALDKAKAFAVRWKPELVPAGLGAAGTVVARMVTRSPLALVPAAAGAAAAAWNFRKSNK